MGGSLRTEAWAYGRNLRNYLLSQYSEEYGVEVPPPPATIADELLTDFLGVTLRFDPLSLDLYAQTEWKRGKPVVTINSSTHQIPGVKDPLGVQNVAKLHEAIHVARDLPGLKSGPQLPLAGVDPPFRIACYRRAGAKNGPNVKPDPLNSVASDTTREFWAEEAGRAAAVSHRALAMSPAFRNFVTLAPKVGRGINGEKWRLLYLAAADIGVNVSALVKQLRLEDRIATEIEGGKTMVYGQPLLLEVSEGS
jgi:hypothetical protein